jgi:hypothetical protein
MVFPVRSVIFYEFHDWLCIFPFYYILLKGEVTTHFPLPLLIEQVILYEVGTAAFDSSSTN